MESKHDVIYFMGIGGTLMGSLALLAQEAGYVVKGFDGPIYPPMSHLLAQHKIEVFEQFHHSQLQPPPHLVVVGNANLPRGHEALEHVLNAKLPYTSGAEWLGNTILRDRSVISVAGTHGKTTTTAMIAWILSEAELEPGYLIGGIPFGLDQPAKLGSGKHFVVESDEYDTSYFDRRAKFLHYRPDILVITSLEFDHADIYDSLDSIKYQFQHLLRAVPGNGHIVVPHKHENIDSVLDRGCWTKVTRFVVSNDTIADAEFKATNVAIDGSEFDVVDRNQRVVGRVSWTMLGTHNVANGLSALVACYHAGVPLSVAIECLCTFPGVKRRMEVIAQSESTVIYSDFAHHPTAIKTTLDGLRGHVGNERIVAVVEPGTHTMSLGTHRNQLRNCGQAADEVIWFKSQSIRWDLNALLIDAVVPSKVAEDVDELVAELCAPKRLKTHVVVMSNGAFGGLFEKLTAQLNSVP